MTQDENVSKENDVVRVTLFDFAGEVEKTINTFFCRCGFDELERSFKYCPYCGSKLDWNFKL